MAYSSTLLIQELPSSGQGRTLLFNGSGLPHMGAEWSMKNILKTTWYPGNGDEGTQQIMGPTELPSRWSGSWHRTLLGKTPCLLISEDGTQTNVIQPLDLWDLVEDFARVGFRLRVDWIVQDDSTLAQLGRRTREGRMEELKFEVDRLQDVRWTINFEWQSRGTPTPVKVTSTRANTVNTDSAAYIAKLQALIQSNVLASIQKFQPTNLTLGQLEAFANLPLTYVNSLARKVQQLNSDMSSLASIASTLATQPVQVANRAVDLARDTLASVNQVYDQFSSIPYESQSLKQNVADFLRSAKSFAKTQDQAQDCAQAGQEFAAKLEQQIQAYVVAQKNPTHLTNPGLVQTAYIAKQGDTPEKVSMRFYGTADHAVDILRANKLSWYTVTFLIGKILIIPALPAQSATQGV